MHPPVDAGAVVRALAELGPDSHPLSIIAQHLGRTQTDTLRGLAEAIRSVDVYEVEGVDGERHFMLASDQYKLWGPDD